MVNGGLSWDLVPGIILVHLVKSLHHILLVHDLKPPFLDGRVVFTTQQETVSVVKDPTSDIAILAKKGSATLQRVREKKERMNTQVKFWDVAGSRIGKLMGVKEEANPEDKDATDGVGDRGEVDYKESSQFAQHMKSNQAVSTLEIGSLISSSAMFPNSRSDPAMPGFLLNAGHFGLKLMHY